MHVAPVVEISRNDDSLTPVYASSHRSAFRSARPYKSKVLVSLQSAQMNDDSLTLVNVRACAVACSVEVVGVCRVDNCAVL